MEMGDGGAEMGEGGGSVETGKGTRAEQPLFLA